VGYRHTKEEILNAALDAALDEGLSQLTFGRLAKRLKISDRIIVYYFPTKDDLIGDVLVAMGIKLQAALAPALSIPAANHVELLRAAWPILAHPDADPVFALFFEVGGLAAIGREPYHTLVPQLIQAWIEWAYGVLSGTPSHRRVEAETAIATIDGLLLTRQLAGPTTADRAARRIMAQRSNRPH
jgi:AcrR family transcriptional regulator